MQDPKQYQADLVNKMVEEIFAIVASESNQSGYAFGREIVMKFLMQYVGTCVVNSLLGPAENMPNGTPEAAKFAASWVSFKEEKMALESAIADGVRAGWLAYAPKTDPEFIVQILTVTSSPSDPKISH